MAHPAALWGRLTCDEPDNRLGNVLLHEGGGVLLVSTADLADHDDRISVRILLERAQAVDEVSSDNGVATDANARALTDPVAGEVIHDLVGQGAASGHQADAARCTDISGN